jgi:murein DD-endopeptidase MepM/ murein hydrolase activator NlpD
MTLSKLAAFSSLLLLVWLMGCRPASASYLPSTITPTSKLPNRTDTPTSLPTWMVEKSASATSEILVPSTVTPTPTPAPTACDPDLCIYQGRLVLQRPIAPPGRDSIDGTYRFGTTQGGLRDPHHGVEFLNSLGTPVLAAADGLVVVAGDDRQTFYGPYSYFYGNLVVLQHRFPGITETVYTLYGHLSELSVKTGDVVQAGEEIGKVGMTGVATGSHLHFEVRLGENTYQNSRNPELYLVPHLDENGQPGGSLAGRVLDRQGNPMKVDSIVLEHLIGQDGPADMRLYLETYAEKVLIGRSPYQESFAAGDLPAGWYRISFIQNGMQKHQVQILPDQLTVATFHPDQP